MQLSIWNSALLLHWQENAQTSHLGLKHPKAYLGRTRSSSEPTQTLEIRIWHQKIRELHSWNSVPSTSFCLRKKEVFDQFVQRLPLTQAPKRHCDRKNRKRTLPPDVATFFAHADLELGRTRERPAASSSNNCLKLEDLEGKV